MTKVQKLLSSLGTGSTKRLKEFRSNLKRDYDKRNFDKTLLHLTRKYVKHAWKGEFTRTLRYLWNLRSSKDGKLFSQGVKEYGKLKASAIGFTEANHTYFGWNKNYKAAKEEVIAEMRKHNLRPLSYHSDGDIRENLPKLDTHAGFTFILSGKKEKGANLEGIFERWRSELHQALEDGTFGKPILPAVRTQGNGHAFREDGSFTGDCDHKTRMVSMVDLMVIITELIFAKPFQGLMAKLSWYAGGKDLDHDIARIVTQLRSNHSHWVSLDYSAFDQSISAWLIHDAFEVIKAAFPNLSQEEEQIFSLIERDFIEKDFVMGDEVLHSVKGVPSGSMFTQIVDSIVNRLVIKTYLHACMKEGEMIVMGDDNLLYTWGKLDVAHLSGYVAKNFGLKVNVDKTKWGRTSDHPTFLSSEWWPEGRYREPHELISKMFYPERERKYKVGYAKPEEVLWSYCLAYPIGMRIFLDVDAFAADHPGLARTALTDLSSHSLPGFLKYLVTYTDGVWSESRRKAS